MLDPETRRHTVNEQGMDSSYAALKDAVLRHVNHNDRGDAMDIGAVQGWDDGETYWGVTGFQQMDDDSLNVMSKGKGKGKGLLQLRRFRALRPGVSIL